MIPFLLLYKTMQLFAVMAIGFLLVKLRLLHSDDSVSLSRVSLYILMPVAIINSFSVKLSRDILLGFLLACGAGVAIHLLMLAVERIFAKTAHATAVERASVFYSNAANLIIPIVSFILGDEWVIYSLGFLSVQLVFIWSHGICLFRSGERLNLKKILLNPNIIAIGVGLVILLTGITLPGFVTDITASLGGVLGYVGMLIAGMTAAGLNFKEAAKNKRLYLTAAMRNIVCPLVTLAAIKLVLPFIPIAGSDNILLISFLATMTPSAATVMQFAQIYDTEADYSVAINILTTLISCVSIPLFVLVYQAL